MLWHSGASEVTMTFTLELPFETFESLFLFGLEWQVAVRLKIPLELTELLSFFGSSRFSVKKNTIKRWEEMDAMFGKHL